jgi:Na+-translocating ferredoxin:NAD+ oxidoreductase subunit C
VLQLKRTGFRHGVHPPERKDLTSALPIRRMPFPDEVVLPLRQHAGKPARPLVAKGDRVERGDKLAAADGYISVPVHASAAGVVMGIDWSPHPDGSMAEAIRIRVDPHSVQVPRPRLVPRWETLRGEEVAAAVQEAGVVGMGGAAFPAHVKMVPPKDVPVEVLILNGAECEPYLTTDHRVMVEFPERVIFGARIMMAALGVGRCVIGVEANKPDAVERLRAALPSDLDVTVLALQVKYPQGAEKMLIHSITGREVPSGKLPASVGAVVQNVGTVATIAEVFETGLPLVERVVTVSGRGIRRPANLLLPVGTPLRDVIGHCGGFNDGAAEVIFGGPMMGFVQADLDVPITKGVTGVLVLTHDEIAHRRTHPCIKCGRCVDACPAFLVPQQLGALAQLGRYEEMEAWNLADCMLCGSCSYVCPSHLPLSQMFALSKAALRRQKARSA